MTKRILQDLLNILIGAGQTDIDSSSELLTALLARLNLKSKQIKNSDKPRRQIRTNSRLQAGFRPNWRHVLNGCYRCLPDYQEQLGTDGNWSHADRC
jgi:hypothetical protein